MITSPKKTSYGQLYLYILSTIFPPSCKTRYWGIKSNVPYTLLTWNVLYPWYGCFLVSISHNTMPKLYTSALVVICFASSSSGAIHAGVPFKSSLTLLRHATSASCLSNQCVMNNKFIRLSMSVNIQLNAIITVTFGPKGKTYKKERNDPMFQKVM